MVSDSDKKQLIKLNQQLSGEIKIGLSSPEHAQTHAFKEFCDELAQLVPQIKITSEDSSPNQPPQILSTMERQRTEGSFRI